jgi:hypothetical protein
VEDIRALVVPLLVIPAYHEIVTIGAVADSGLVHDTEVVTILEHLFTSFMRVNANNLGHMCARTFQVILLNGTVSFEDAPSGLRRVERE